MYKAIAGEAPWNTTILKTDKTGLSTYRVSEWRRVKKAHTRARRGW
jgi:hypothetical protein